ncbi:hypothetical protein ATO11_08525 [Pseudaestuariivita atlantica]|uniref:Uncharacterized protein n=1 Tax=Pseudaestuariivita atlantica TaxID=1317121 RepID=A0A0L1JRV5_9RHOB|nr:molybdenum ABC transporter ATP-binding protein [Pseudaestuariivita atlantica]KNG94461.1 hypothetical protein ATO11_08525 [Pseudaestuariivita atlantica]
MLDIAIGHRFGPDGPALDVAFTAPPGVTALFGRSGAGKTSIVRAVAGLLKPDVARIVVGERVLCDSTKGLWVPVHRRRTGYVFQEPRLFPHRDVLGNILYGAPGRSLSQDDEAIVDMLGLRDLLRRNPATLSGGEAQRVAIARALVSRPDMLLMDEPLASLDSTRKAQILPYLERLRAEARVPILYVSHDISEVARLADTLVVLDRGTSMAAGPAVDLLADPALARHIGALNTGAVLSARLSRADAGDGLSEIDLNGVRMLVPQVAARPGAALRLRIPATDVMLAATRPEGLSALNVLPVRIVAVEDGRGPGVMVQLELADTTEGPVRLLSRITRRSARALDIRAGASAFAILKTVSVAPAAIGGAVLTPSGAPLSADGTVP